MMQEVIKDIANTVRSAVSNGIESLEPRLKALEERPVAQDVEPLLQEMVSKAVGAIEAPKGEDGKSVTVEDVEPLLQEMVSKAVGAILPDIIDKVVKSVPVPKDGKDALEIEILPCIDIDKSYVRGTFATHDGGLWRSYEKTHGMRGWECIVNGVKSHSVEYDGLRKAVIKSIMSDGTETEQQLNIPAVLNKGVWRDGEYEKGDMVQLSGSSWVCVEDTNERPSIDCKSWLLAAKKGGTGDSAYDIARKAGFQGDKQAWLDSLAKKTTVKVN